jgi:hypothetical protein
MNKKQWNVLGISSVLLGIIFMKISLLSKASCGFDDVTMLNIFSCIRGEVFPPFVYLLFGFGFIFIILGWLDPKKK